MTIQEFKASISTLEEIHFSLPNGRLIPAYFHITEMGLKTKSYIDCGTTVRSDSFVTFQIWHAQDYQHRLSPEKLNKIVKAAEPLFENKNPEIEVEYQGDLSLSVFGLELKDGVFHLTAKESTCLASDHCGIPAEKMKVNLRDLIAGTKACSPDGKCC